jgi:hypothetical protein
MYEIFGCVSYPVKPSGEKDIKVCDDGKLIQKQDDG